MSGTTSAMVRAAPVLSARAAAFGRYPSSAATARTDASVAAEIGPAALPEKTSETVDWDTPAACATSTLVTRGPPIEGAKACHHGQVAAPALLPPVQRQRGSAAEDGRDADFTHRTPTRPRPQRPPDPRHASACSPPSGRVDVLLALGDGSRRYHELLGDLDADLREGADPDAPARWSATG